VLIIERGSGFDAVRRFLKDVGYGLFVYDVSADRMTRDPARHGRPIQVRSNPYCDILPRWLAIATMRAAPGHT
jgi:hypothetical protein